MGPRSIALRTYQVGFGDCFLLTFGYEQEERHVLIDFGTTSLPKGYPGDHMVRVAGNIRERCGGKLHAVVATHRHRDHIGGFTTEGQAPGRIIAECDPEVVIQPWTEDPEAELDAKAPTRVRAFRQSLHAMHEFAAAALKQLGSMPYLPARMREELQFIGEDNLPNLSAVRNLQAMGKSRIYAHAGSVSGLEGVLPGVQVNVLGPPTLEQSETIRRMRSTDPGEFWHLRARYWGFAAEAAATAAGAPLFPGRPSEEMPVPFQWLKRRMREMRGEELLELVRALDRALNNTSLILLFSAGGRKLLFPGDAQIENWAYALEQEETRALLEDVDVYKVGHHGSLNATPKTLWGWFRKRSAEESPERLRAIVSTMHGKHGSEERKTEVPRRTLVQALRRETTYFTTASLTEPEKFFEDLTLELAVKPVKKRRVPRKRRIQNA
ncbi:MAG: hypothetical protein ACK5AZ_07285 [Bryobacteraceae bacterium]